MALAFIEASDGADPNLRSNPGAAIGSFPKRINEPLARPLTVSINSLPPSTELENSS